MALDAPAHAAPASAAASDNPPVALSDLLTAIGNVSCKLDVTTEALETRYSSASNSMREETRSALAGMQATFKHGMNRIEQRMAALERQVAAQGAHRAASANQTLPNGASRRQPALTSRNGPALTGKPEPLELTNALSPASVSPLPAQPSDPDTPPVENEQPDESEQPTGNTLPAAGNMPNGFHGSGLKSVDDGDRSPRTPTPEPDAGADDLVPEGEPLFTMHMEGPSMPAPRQSLDDLDNINSTEMAAALQAVVPDTPAPDDEDMEDEAQPEDDFGSPLPAAAAFTQSAGAGFVQSTPDEPGFTPISPVIRTVAPVPVPVIVISDNEDDDVPPTGGARAAPAEPSVKTEQPSQQNEIMTDAEYANQMSNESGANNPVAPEIETHQGVENPVPVDLEIDSEQEGRVDSGTNANDAGAANTFETPEPKTLRKLPDGLVMSEPVPSAKVGGKRKRSSLPFTNSMTKRKQMYQSQYKDVSTDEEAEDEEEADDDMSDQDRGVDSEVEDPSAVSPSAYSQSQSAEPTASQGVQRSPGSGSVVRPLPIPHVGVPRTEAEIKNHIRHADEVCRSFCYLDNAGNPKHALELYLSAANAGSVIGMVRAGYMYLTGAKSLQAGTTKVRKNRKLAEYWASEALAKDPNNPEALNFRGEIWESSSGKYGHTFKKALEHYTKSASLGNVQGMYLKGKLWYAYMDKATTEQRRKKCAENIVKNLSDAIDAGSGDAASLLGNVYETEESHSAYKDALKSREGGIDYDADARALELYWLGMNRGSARGTNDVAACYEVAYANLIGNFEMARSFYEQAFTTGHVGAASNLALLFELGGKGVFADSINTEEALRWYKIGHAMDSPSATYYLGCVYDTGSIAPENKLLAEKYFKAAINFAETCQEELDFVGKASIELFGLYATSVILDDEHCPRFLTALKERAKRERYSADAEINKVRKDLGTIISASCDPGSTSAAAQEGARERTKERLGTKNYDLIMKRAKMILRNISRARQANMNTTEEVECLGRIVGQAGISKLGLDLP